MKETRFKINLKMQQSVSHNGGLVPVPEVFVAACELCPSSHMEIYWC